jgi:valyl-tRNA synthetase
MATYSSDAIRYWAASGKLGTDILFNEDQLKIGRRLVTKLWNAFKFNQEHVVGAACTIENLNAQDPLNYWLMQNLCTTYQEFVKAFDAYDYHHALEVTEKFLWNIYCDNYLELVKHRFFKPENHSAELLKETKQTMYVVGLHMLKMFAPVIPHVTDSLYQEMFRPFEKTASIHNHTWQEAKLTGYVVNTTTETIDAVVTAVGAVRKLKSEHALSLKTPLKKLTVVVAEDKKAWFEQVHKTIIAGVSQAESVEFATLAQESYLTESADGWMALVKI